MSFFFPVWSMIYKNKKLRGPILPNFKIGFRSRRAKSATDYTIRSVSMRAFRILSKIQKISIRLEVMAELLPSKFCRPWRSQNWDHRSASILAITSKRIEIFWILDKILKALIEADRMVPLLRVYDIVLNFRFSTKKKRTEKKNVHFVCFFPVACR